MIIGDLQPWNEVQFKRHSRQLDLLSRGDFDNIKLDLVSMYPNTDIPVRAIPFVQRYVAELSGLYQRPVVRRFRGDAIDTATWKSLQDVYAASKVDTELAYIEQQLWTQNSIYVIALPDGPGRVHLQTILPWQIDRVIVRDPLRASEPDQWTEVWIQVPTMVAENQVVYGRMKITRTEAWRDVGGQRVGIYAEDGTNPFGYVPLIAVHRLRPDPGRYSCPIAQSVLNLQVALCVQQADNELIVKHCAWPQKVIENGDIAQLTESISLGPDKVHVLIRTGDPTAPSPVLKVVQGVVPVAELVQMAEHQIRLYCSMLGLDPSSFMRVNTAVTASARLFAAQDRQSQRDKILPVLAELEDQLLKAIVNALRLSQPLPVPANLGVDVTYNMVEQVSDPLNAAQALKTEIELGISSAPDAVRTRDGVGKTEALRTVQDNLAQSRQLGILQEPGAMQTPLAGSTDGGTQA